MYANSSLINYGDVSSATEEKSMLYQNDTSTCGSQHGHGSELDISMSSSASILDESSVRKRLIYKALNREYTRGSITNRSLESKCDSKPSSKASTSRQSVKNAITESFSPMTPRNNELTPTKNSKSLRLKSASLSRAPLSPPRLKTPGKIYKSSPINSPVAPRKEGIENKKTKVMLNNSPNRRVGAENVNLQRSKTPMPRISSPKLAKFVSLTPPPMTPGEERDLTKYTESPEKTEIVEKMIFQAIELQILLEPSINQIRDFFKTLFKNLEYNVALPNSLLQNLENIMKTFHTYKKSKPGRESILMEDILNELYEIKKTGDKSVLPIIRANLRALVSFIEDEESLALESSSNTSSSPKKLYSKSSSSSNLIELSSLSSSKLEMTLGRESETDFKCNTIQDIPESKLRLRLESAFTNELRVNCTPKFSDFRSSIALKTEASVSESSNSIINTQPIDENPLSTQQYVDSEENLFETFSSLAAIHSHLQVEPTMPLYYNKAGCYDCSFGIIKLHEIFIDTNYIETKETITLGSINEREDFSEADESSIMLDSEYKLTDSQDEEVRDRNQLVEFSSFRELREINREVSRQPEKSCIILQLIPEASQEASPECETSRVYEKEEETFLDVDIVQNPVEVTLNQEPISIFETIRQAFHLRSQSQSHLMEHDFVFINEEKVQNVSDKRIRTQSLDFNQNSNKTSASITPKQQKTVLKSIILPQESEKPVLFNTPDKKAKIEEELTRFLSEKLDIINMRKNKSQDLLVQKRKILLDKRTEIMSEFRSKLQTRDDAISPNSRDKIIQQFSQEDLFKETSNKVLKKAQEQEKLREKSSQLKRNHQQLQRDREKLQRLLERYKKK